MGEQGKARRSGPITYGEVFGVIGELGSRAITPRDAAILQSAESMVIGMPQKDGPAVLMREAADENVKLGFVHDQDVTDIVQNQGVTLLEAEQGGCHIVTEVIAGQVLGKCFGPKTDSDQPITIGDALEAATLTVGEKAITKSDAAAIEAAELLATGKERAMPGGIAEEAYWVAEKNLQAERDEDKIKLRDVLADASKKFPSDKPVGREVAQAAIVAEAKHIPDVYTKPGGVISSLAGAARLNEQK